MTQKSVRTASRVLWNKLFTDTPPCFGNWDCLIHTNRYRGREKEGYPKYKNGADTPCSKKISNLCRSTNMRIAEKSSNLSRAISNEEIEALEAIQILRKQKKWKDI